MKALSLWQPWASLVADGRKRIETRSWRPPNYLVGHWLAIHATKRGDAAFAEGCGYDIRVIPRGAIVACAFLDSWMYFTPQNTEYISDDEKKYGDFTEGRFGWKFSEIRKLPEPLAWRGAQGIFEVNIMLPR
jgi:activating signal cointegrator 1